MLDLLSSPLIAHLVDEPQSEVWDFYSDGDYPGLETVKAEVEASVTSARLSAAAARHKIEETIARKPAFDDYARLVLKVDPIAQAPRLAAFLSFAAAVQEAERGLHYATLAFPRSTDRAFAIPAGDALFARLSRDGLLPLTPDLIPPAHGGSYAHLTWLEQALFPHPWLCDKRELVFELLELATDPTVTVAMAIDPLRRVAVADVPTWILEDYWHGVVLDELTLDSLDQKHLGESFHAAGERNAAGDYFFPLLGTRFSWGRRDDDPNDPVKSMFVEEVVPPDSRVSSDDDYVWTRGAHAERDTKSRRFVHLDGKVKVYEKDSYLPSAASPNAALGAAARMRKLWRVDGPLADECFASLLGTFFRGNELVGEHFQEALRWPAAA